jgi:hypothetical protein
METNNIDYRLDIYNAIDRYQEQMTEHDALFAIMFNTLEGDLYMAPLGDVNLLSLCLANDDNCVPIKTNLDKRRHDHAKSMVLNMAINILRTDKALKEKFDIALTKI